MIQLESLTVERGSRRILTDISLIAHAGEVFGLLGPNGAGKSTLLNVLGGMNLSYQGRVVIKDHALKSWNSEELAQFRAVVFQHATMSFPFTCREVVLMGRYPHMALRASEKDEAVVREAMACLGVAHLAAVPFGKISGGEAQRVQIARAMAQIWDVPPDQGPRLLLLDEPTASLDWRHQREVLRLIRSLAAKQVAVIIILHDLNLAAEFCDRVALLAEGRLAALGKPADILTATTIESVFGVATTVLRHDATGRRFIIPCDHKEEKHHESKNIRQHGESLASVSV